MQYIIVFRGTKGFEKLKVSDCSSYDSLLFHPHLMIPCVVYVSDQLYIWMNTTYRTLPPEKIRQNCTTPPFGISLGWTSIILGCIPKHRKKFGMDPKLRPSQSLTIHPLQLFWHIPHSEPNWKTCVYLKSSINQSGFGGLSVKVKVQFAVHCKIVLKWSWLLAEYVFCFGSISICISQNKHKVITKVSETDPKVVTKQSSSKWSPSGNQSLMVAN